jgi:predicted Zn-dependent protease
MGMGRILIGLVIAGVALFSFLASREFNPVTGEDQFVAITPEQEIALGLQAAPEMVAQFGGEEPNAQAQGIVDQVGARLIQNSVVRDTNWQWEFTVLNDPQTINAFALPGGQIFITEALLARMETEGQLAGVLGHEIGHVVARHGAQHLAKEQLTQGLIGAVAVAASNPDDPNGASAAQIAAVVGQLVNMRYGREDELESDSLGVRVMAEAGYDPRSMIRVQEILMQSSEGGGRPPEFFSTHPNPENRIARIQEAIQQQFPNGVPSGLTP